LGHTWTSKISHRRKLFSWEKAKGVMLASAGGLPVRLRPAVRVDAILIYLYKRNLYFETAGYLNTPMMMAVCDRLMVKRIESVLKLDYL
jgi:hypothetical protein